MKLCLQIKPIIRAICWMNTKKKPFVLIPEDKDCNGNLYENAPKALKNQLKKNFKHIRQIVGKLD